MRVFTECLDKVFKWLGFQVEVENNCEGSRMLSLVRELSRRDHSHTDCLVCCVLSHGKEDGVYGVDGNVVAIKQLTEFFDGTNCRSLAGKPKLFFIQACQGNKEQRAVYIESDGPSQSRSRSRSLVQSDAVVIRDSIPADADFLLGMATVNSFTCYRDKVEGTWYIQTLCRNLVRLVPRLADHQSRSSDIIHRIPLAVLHCDLYVSYFVFQWRRPHVDPDQSERRRGPENKLHGEQTDASTSLLSYQEGGLPRSQ